MTLLKASFWNAIAISVRLVSALILNKALALFLGPSGYAVMGQFQNGFSMISSFSSTAFQPGVVKAVAETGASSDGGKWVFKTALSLVIIASLLLGVVVAVASKPLSQYLFHRDTFGFVFVVVAVTLLPSNLGNLFLSLLNGAKAFREYSIANIGSTLISLATTLLLAWRLGLSGALLALAISPALSMVSVWLISRPFIRMAGGLTPLGMDPAETVRLGKFALMGLTTALTGPVSQILIRQAVANAYGFDAAGIWDGLNKMSTLYLTFFITTMSIYYLPRISEAKNWSQLAGDMWNIGALAVSGVAFCAVVIFLFRKEIVALLFSVKFEKMSELIRWQVCGDVAKIASWVIAYIMVGRGKTSLFIASEIIFSVSLVVLTITFINVFGFVGVSMAYAANYAIYGFALYLWFLSTRARRDAIFK